MTPHDAEEGLTDEVLAGEYALGVLDAEARSQAETRSNQDPVFASEVFAWTRRLAALVDAAPIVKPSAGLWRRIETNLGDRIKAPAQAKAPIAANDSASGLAAWRAWAVGATAIAACALLALGVVGLGRRPHQTALDGGPTLVATLGLKENGAPAVTVAYDPSRATIYASPDGEFSIPKSRSAELWLIPPDGKPRAMGVIDPAKPATMPMPPEFRALAKDQAAVALSIEPEGGSKTGAPTGPVIASGTLSIV